MRPTCPSALAVVLRERVRAWDCDESGSQVATRIAVLTNAGTALNGVLFDAIDGLLFVGWINDVLRRSARGLPRLRRPRDVARLAMLTVTLIIRAKEIFCKPVAATRHSGASRCLCS